MLGRPKDTVGGYCFNLRQTEGCFESNQCLLKSSVVFGSVKGYVDNSMYVSMYVTKTNFISQGGDIVLF